MFLPDYEDAMNAFKQRRYEGDTWREYDSNAALLVNPHVLMKILIAWMGWIRRVPCIFCCEEKLAHACYIYTSWLVCEKKNITDKCYKLDREISSHDLSSFLTSYDNVLGRRKKNQLRIDYFEF